MSKSKNAWFETFAAIVAEEDGDNLANEVLEKDFDRAPVVVQTAPVAPVVDVAPDLGNLSVVKIPHLNLVLDGVCTHCAHCGHMLTDAVSIQRGIGPICSKKGYLEDPVDSDEIQAMIDLAEFPDLVKFLAEHYKPLGIRGLINGLVRVASLNRPHGKGQSEGNAKVHAACCDAVESLGHKKLATLLRHSLVAMTLAKSEKYSGCMQLHIKYKHYRTSFAIELEMAAFGVFTDKHLKVMVIPVHEPGNPKNVAYADVVRKISNKSVLWDMLQKYYPGYVMKTDSGVVKIK